MRVTLNSRNVFLFSFMILSLGVLICAATYLDPLNEHKKLRDATFYKRERAHEPDEKRIDKHLTINIASCALGIVSSIAQSIICVLLLLKILPKWVWAIIEGVVFLFLVIAFALSLSHNYTILRLKQSGTPVPYKFEVCFFRKEGSISRLCCTPFSPDSSGDCSHSALGR